MNFSLPPDLVQYLEKLDAFIEREIKPLQTQDDNSRFFDYRREHARTDWDNGGLPRPEWEALLDEAVRLADVAGFWRLSLPRAYGGQNDNSALGMNLWMAVIREHLAAKGLGLFNDLQTEHSVVGNFPDIAMLLGFGTAEQKKGLIKERLKGRVRISFGLTEPGHGSDATYMATRAVRKMRAGEEGYVINGWKKWHTGFHRATHSFVFTRTSGRDGDARGISCFIVPKSSPGLTAESFEWTLNMPTDHATIRLKDVFVPSSALLGPLDGGLQVAQTFLNENRIRQAASSLGAASYCIKSCISHANMRSPFGIPLSQNQAIQFPLVELSTQVEMLRLLVYKTASLMDEIPHADVERKMGDKVSMCNYFANRLVCEAADRAIQVHGGMGYSRHMPFEFLWRHFRRYRITEGSEEIQMRKVAKYLFGFGGKGRGGETDVESKL